MSTFEATAIVEKRAKPNLFQWIKAQNLLSFGPDGIDLELGPLNVLIGPNGSGKSNLLEIFSLFQAAPDKLAKPVGSGGGIQDWIWRGDSNDVAYVSAEIAGMLTQEFGKFLGIWHVSLFVTRIRCLASRRADRPHVQ